MVTRDDIELLVRVRNTNIALAQQRLAEAFSTISVGTPDQVRDALLELVPALVHEHGEIAAAAAADWYEQMRAKAIPGTYRALTGDYPPFEQIEASVRYAAGELFGDDPATTLRLLEGAVQRLIKYQEDDTFRVNAEADPARPRFAFVPRPPMTCSWCDMLASRGWVYLTQETATASKHTHCDCTVTPSWDWESAHIDGYDPAASFGRYLAARDSLDSDAPTGAEVAGRMRELFADEYTDGLAPPKRSFVGDKTIDMNVWARRRKELARKAKQGYYGNAAAARLIPPETPVTAPRDWPADLPELTDKTWNHVLFGVDGRGGHLPGYGWINNGTQFPAGWSANDIKNAAVAVLRSGSIPDADWRQGVITGTVSGHELRVALSRAKSGKIRVRSIYKLDPTHGDRK